MHLSEEEEERSGDGDGEEDGGRLADVVIDLMTARTLRAARRAFTKTEGARAEEELSTRTPRPTWWVPSASPFARPAGRERRRREEGEGAGFPSRPPPARRGTRGRPIAGGKSGPTRRPPTTPRATDGGSRSARPRRGGARTARRTTALRSTPSRPRRSRVPKEVGGVLAEGAAGVSTGGRGGGSVPSETMI